jgi:type II secretory pathway pseudopilin PulG
MAHTTSGHLQHMNSLMRLIAKVAGAAADAARTALQLAEAAAELAIDRARSRSRAPAPAPPARTDPAPPPAAGATAAKPAGAPRAPAPPPTPPTDPDPPPLTVIPEPTRGQAGRIRSSRRAREQTPASPGAEVHVAEPWAGYEGMTAADIVARLRTADDAEKAVVLLYEGTHRKRKTVLRAVEPVAAG